MLQAIRTVIATGHFLIICTYALIYCLLFPRRLDSTQRLASMMSWVLPVLGVRFKAKRELPISDNQQVVYVINHQDTLDVFICSAMLPPKIAMLGKSQLKYIPVFGLAFWLAGNIYIDRGDKSKAWEVMASVARKIKRRGCSLYIFPEGTRSRGRGMLPFKSGAFALAISSGLPIVPIVFSSTHKNIDLNCWYSGVCLGEYLDPIATNGLTEADIKPLMDEARNRMLAAQERLDREIEEAQAKPQGFMEYYKVLR